MVECDFLENFECQQLKENDRLSEGRPFHPDLGPEMDMNI